jgi:hypothetical protein
MIALSLLVLAGMLLSGQHFGLSTVPLAFTGFGLFHGAAFGEPLAIQPRLVGAMVAGAGLYLMLEHLEGSLLQAISS